MTTFLQNHSKIQEIESRLNKNQYLSNECLPNFIDAQVFKALKTSNQIPKRQVYPNFYHWYILMRQFADRTLEYWLKNDNVQKTDHVIEELLKIFQRKQHYEIAKLEVYGRESHEILTKCSHNPIIENPERKDKCDVSFPLHKDHKELRKLGFFSDKKNSTHDDTVNEYLISIKVSCVLKREFGHIKKLFDVQKVKLKSVRISKEKPMKENEFYLWAYFETSNQICEELKNSILRYSYVQTIQCKKLRKNKRLRMDSFKVQTKQQQKILKKDVDLKQQVFR